jgi:replicative DNA helicase
MKYDLELRDILEKEIISSLLNNSDLFFTKKHTLVSDNFSAPQHKLIYSAILKSIKDFNTVSLSTVRESVKDVSDGELSTNDVISLMSDYKPYTGALFDKHCSSLMDYNTCDMLTVLATEINSYNKQDINDFEGRVNSWKAEISEIGQGVSTEVSLKEEVSSTIATILLRMTSKEPILGLDSGTRDVNDFTAGWLSPDLIILAGRPGMGKSAYAIFNCKKIILEDVPAALISYEMPSSQILERMVASMAKVNSKKMLKGELSAEEWKRTQEAFLHIENKPLHLIDKPLSLSRLINRIRYLVLKHGVKIVYIDYVQLVPNDIDKVHNEDLRIGGISRRLKLLAMELQIPIVLLSQLSRAVEGRGGLKKPNLADLRGSGSLEQDADIVGFFYRPDYYKISMQGYLNDGENLCQLLMLKGRRIGTAEFDLFYRMKYNYFEDWDNHHVKHF